MHNTEDVQKLASLVVDWMRHLIREEPERAAAMKLERVVASCESGTDRICRSAPHIVIAHAARNDVFAPLSAPIATTYLELAAPSLGLGTCWGGYFTAAAKSWRPMQEALGLPEGHVLFGTILVGYPKYPHSRLPLRNKPRISWF